MIPGTIGDREEGLRRGLSKTQIGMIGLGGAIGTGLFMGSGLAIAYAGPAVIVSYMLAGFVALVVVFSLSEMAVVHPTAGSLGTYAELYLNPWAGFVVRYTYWIAQVIGVAGEAVAAGLYMQYWFPQVPVWMWAVGFCLLMLYFNSRAVGSFGAVESWLALIKVLTILVFIFLGVGIILGAGRIGAALHNLTALPGGFAPKGLAGVWLGVTVGIFSFYGVEVIAVTSGEAKNPEAAIPAALRTMVLRLFLFYVPAVTIIVTTVPWMLTGVKVVAQSPFVTVFQQSGIRDAAGIMNFVVVTAALSSMNASVYLSSRMLFSLSRGGYAPQWLGRLSTKGSPVAAILVSGAFVLLAAAVSAFTPDAYADLLGVALFGGIVVWMFILISHLRFRRRRGRAEMSVRMPLFPWMQYLGLAILAAILVTMAFTSKLSVCWVYGVPWLAVVSIAYFVWRVRRRSSATTGLIVLTLTMGALSLHAPAVHASTPRLQTPLSPECQRLGATANDHLVISSVRWMSAGPLPASVTRIIPNSAPVRLPAHGMVRVILDPRIGSSDATIDNIAARRLRPLCHTPSALDTGWTTSTARMASCT